MAEFVKPSSGRMTKLSDDSFEFEGYPMDKVFSPTDGRVTKVSLSSCGGLIEIEHNFNGDYLMSRFCQVQTILVSSGDRVGTRQVIGKYGGSSIIYTLMNSRGSVLNAKSYFGSSSSSSSSNPTGERNSTKPKSNTTQTTGNYSNQPTKGIKITKGLGLPHQILADLLGSPKGIFKDKYFFKPGKLFQKKSKNENVNQTSDEFDRLLSEEINKIKSLLK